VNEIEQRFYDVFQEYARLSPSFTVMDCYEEFKIADCRNARKCTDEMLKTLVSIAYSRSVDIISSVHTANVLYWDGE
jgi:hypothetical protein